MESIYKSYYHVSFGVSPFVATLHDSLRTFGHPFLELWRLFDLVVNRLERLVAFESLLNALLIVKEVNQIEQLNIEQRQARTDPEARLILCRLLFECSEALRQIFLEELLHICITGRFSLAVRRLDVRDLFAGRIYSQRNTDQTLHPLVALTNQSSFDIVAAHHVETTGEKAFDRFRLSNDKLATFVDLEDGNLLVDIARLGCIPFGLDVLTILQGERITEIFELLAGQFEQHAGCFTQTTKVEVGQFVGGRGRRRHI